MDDDSTVTRFISLTNSSVEQARFFLEATGGQLERAVAMYFEQGTALPNASAPLQVPPRPARGPQPPPLVRQRGLLNMLVMVPYAIIRTTFNVLFSALGVSLSLANYVGQRILPAPVLEGLRGAANAIGQGAEEADPQLAAESFISKFSAKYGDRRPRFVEAGWQEAAAQAHSQYKFLFVYLHSPNHQDTDDFCSRTLCSSEVVDYVNRSFVCWGGDIRYSHAFRLSVSLRVSRYPYVALLAFSGANIRLVSCVEGSVPASQLLDVLHKSFEEHRGLMETEQAAITERERARRLREEQDAEYQRALEADRERERAREEARRKEQEAARLAAEAAAKAKAEQEAKENKAAQFAAALNNRKKQKQAQLKPEPVEGSSEVTSMRIRLPDGSNAQRRFLSSDSLQWVADFVESLDSMRHLKYSLVNTYPRKVYGTKDMSMSLEELGLAPSAALFIQPEDDD